MKLERSGVTVRKYDRTSLERRAYFFPSPEIINFRQCEAARYFSRRKEEPGSVHLRFESSRLIRFRFSAVYTSRNGITASGNDAREHK